jgi:hypothetical protein
MVQMFGNPFVVGLFSFFIEAVSPKSLTLSFWHLAVFYYRLEPLFRARRSSSSVSNDLNSSAPFPTLKVF